MAITRKIENSILEFYNGKWIIWKNHNKDFTLGSYYILNADGTVDFVEETATNLRHFCNIYEERKEECL